MPPSGFDAAEPIDWRITWALKALLDKFWKQVGSTAKAVVVDVRLNEGGYDAFALQIAERFVPRSKGAAHEEACPVCTPVERPVLGMFKQLCQPRPAGAADLTHLVSAAADHAAAAATSPLLRSPALARASGRGSSGRPRHS